jgi:uncharacterized repeat protein (TIGR03803 family)
MHNLISATEGNSPRGQLLQIWSGLLYGTTELGGTGAQGTIFSTAVNGNVTVLQSLTGANGARALPLVVGNPGGNMFGVSKGGPQAGTFFVLSPAGAMKGLHSFTNLEGTPSGPLLLANDGNFYGTTTGSVQDNLYKVTHTAAVTVLHSFPGGSRPAGSLLQASNGQIYGVVQIGSNPSGFGFVYRMPLTGAGANTPVIIHTFAGVPDGARPVGGLIQASDGNIYGTSAQGGTFGFGTIFKVTLGDQYSTVLNFNLSNGIYPESTSTGVMQGSDGKLYGTATSGGANSGGTVYSLDLGLPKPKPGIGSFSPTNGLAGIYVVLAGRNLVGVSSVRFNGIAATSFFPVGSNYVYAQVPSGATTGPISLTTPGGTTTSATSFTVP